MAAAVARPPSQAPRRRESQRPSMTKRAATTEEPAVKRRKLDEPHVRDSAYILRKHAGKTPSLVVHLHPTHFRFDGQDGSFAYDSPVKVILQHLRSQTVPHEMLDELLQQNVPWYDGCLIVEVHNHKSAGAKAGNKRGTVDADDGVRFSMNNYNEHITPSPFAPYPKKAAESSPKPKVEDGASGDMAAPERPKKDKGECGPKIATVVLHPTPLSMHYELLLLAETPVPETGNKKNSKEAEANTHPQTPRLSVPPTPTMTSRGPLTVSQKMMLEDGDMYGIEAEMLVATQPPLILDPVNNFEESQRLIEYMAHPLHSGKPPSPKTRKRTTAQMAADDAQAAEAERRMLIMDERIKPSGRAGAGASANDNQGAAASLNFSRFKTLDMVRTKHEETERIKKEEESRAAVEKKQYEEQMAREKLTQQTEQRRMLAQQQQQQLQHRQALILQQRRNQEQQQQLAAAQAQQHQQQLLAQQQAQQNHGHPQQGLQQPGQVAQHSSPVAQQQTPMMHSSPMLGNGGFPMVPTSSQGAGSPPRPTSAAVPQHVSMVRNQSQQQGGTRHNTPQMPQGTPNMAQAMPNRGASQTPRMTQGSPAPTVQQDGTPVPMSMPTPHFNNQGPQQLTPEQMMLLSQRNQQNLQHQGMAGSPQVQMTPEQFQQASTQAQAAFTHRRKLEAARMTQLKLAQQALMQQNQQLANQHNAQAQKYGLMLQQSGGPASHQQNPNMSHGHPGQQQQQHNMNNMNMQQQHLQQQQQGDPQMLAQQQAMQAQARQQNAMQQQAAMQAKLQQVAQQNGGFHMIPPQIVQQMPLVMQNMLRRQQAAQRQAQQMAMQRQQQQGVGNVQDPEAYMRNLRQQQVLLAGQMQQNGGQGQGSPMGQMTPGGMNQMMQQQGGGNMMNQAQFQQAMAQHQAQQQQNGGQGQQQGGGDNLNASFAAMQNALNDQQRGRQ